MKRLISRRVSRVAVGRQGGHLRTGEDRGFDIINCLDRRSEGGGYRRQPT